MATIKIFASARELYEYAAKDFSQRAAAAVNDKGSFSVVLSGGNTPKSFFDILASQYKENIAWRQIQFFFGDERYVPIDDSRSNYRMASKHLFSKAPIDPKNIYRMPTNFNDPSAAAMDYEQTLRKVFDIKDNAFPAFDLIYLGLGEDAHTASLMPESSVVKNHLSHPTQLVAALFQEEEKLYRITLTPAAINHAHEIIFLVTGENKANAVQAVLSGHPNTSHYPAQLIQSIEGQTLWFLDQPAIKYL